MTVALFAEVEPKTKHHDGGLPLQISDMFSVFAALHLKNKDTKIHKCDSRVLSLVRMKRFTKGRFFKRLIVGRSSCVAAVLALL